MSYAEFLARKQRIALGVGIQGAALPSALYDWQTAIVRWALKKGRAAIFADCGLGKTYMQTAWAQAIPGRVLILAPLCVAEQTVREAANLEIPILYATSGIDAPLAKITITNYERINTFDPADYTGVVLDESSILKSFDGKTRAKLIETFQRTRYRLCCTATPSPNDISELANHAEFLGLVTRAEFLASWFVHDDAGWRMKGHAVEPFYRWMASWAIALRKPSDIGYADTGYDLPPLRIHEHIVESEGSSGDAAMFLAVTKHRDNALRWINRKTTQNFDYVIACDLFKEVRLNMSAIVSSIKAIRQLERCGTSSMLERAFKGFSALPEYRGAETTVQS